ncbi:MAG: sugar ABC transporter permease [Sphaerochaetaceae bacterium]
MKTALINCLRYAVISVICQVFFGMILASILEDPSFRFIAGFFRTIYFIPTVISLTVICLLFGFIYNPRSGLLNAFLELIGLDSFTNAWLGKGSTAIYATIAVSQWQSIGYIMMLFIVAIQKVPVEYYEAAEIDGASKIRKFFSITLPQVREMFFVTMIITVSGSMTVFNEPYILTKGGGPGTSSITMSLYMYQLGFIRDRMGFGSTVAVFIFFLCVLLAILQSSTFRTGKGE